MLSRASQHLRRDRDYRVTDIGHGTQRMLPPIKGFEKAPLGTLERAVAPLEEQVPGVLFMVQLVKEECLRRQPTSLTLDQRASIMLFTLEWTTAESSLYFILNRTLRSTDRSLLKPWYRYLKLFITALDRLPSFEGVVYRGVRGNLLDEYPDGGRFIWWAFSSCTKSVRVLEEEQFLGKDGERTLFAINCRSGKDIQEHSFIQHENEVLLLAARFFSVQGSSNLGNGLHMIQINEIEPPFTLLADVSSDSCHYFVPDLSADARWRSQGETILEDLRSPEGLVVDENDSMMYVVDRNNHRVVAVTIDPHSGSKGNTVAGGNSMGNHLDQLNNPTDVLIDRKRDSLIICDHGNNRIMRWSLKKDTTTGEILINNIMGCYGLGMDREGHLYVSSITTHDIKRFVQGDRIGTVVVGTKGVGAANDQLNRPCFIAVNDQGDLYVSDSGNHRVMKWEKGGTEGIVVAGGRGSGTNLTQLSNPMKVLVDTEETVYVAEWGNNRITRWKKGSPSGEIIIGEGGDSEANEAHQIHWPRGFAVDSYGNIFVSSLKNHCVRRFSIL